MEISIAYVVFGPVFFLVTGITYASVVGLIVWNRSLHDSSNFFLANLCVSDFLLSVAIFVHCMFAAGFGSADKAVEVRVVTIIFGVATSSYCISSLIVAADRYFRVASPMRYIIFTTRRRCTCIIAGSWATLTITALIWQLATSLVRTDPDPFIGSGDATQTSPEAVDEHLILESYAIFTTVLTVPCLMLTAVFCICLVGIARKQARRIHDEARAFGNGCAGSLEDRQAGTARGHHAPQPQPGRVPNRGKANAYLRTYLGSFVICWLPYPIIINIFIFVNNLGITHFLTQMFALSLSPIVQVYFGTLFLTYSQAEHRQVLRKTYRSCLKKVLCRSDA